MMLPGFSQRSRWAPQTQDTAASRPFLTTAQPGLLVPQTQQFHPHCRFP